MPMRACAGKASSAICEALTASWMRVTSPSVVFIEPERSTTARMLDGTDSTRHWRRVSSVVFWATVLSTWASPRPMSLASGAPSGPRSSAAAMASTPALEVNHRVSARPTRAETSRFEPSTSMDPRVTEIMGNFSIGTPVCGTTSESWSLLRRAAR